ncbi:MAG: MoaD/ThiS family protein [Candidatus Woesearchaeota archaeon]
MKIYIERKNQWVEKDIGIKIKVRELLKELGLNPEEVIVVKNDEIITEDDYVTNQDQIKLISVISGG